MPKNETLILFSRKNIFVCATFDFILYRLRESLVSWFRRFMKYHANSKASSLWKMMLLNYFIVTCRFIKVIFVEIYEKETLDVRKSLLKVVF